MDLQLELAASLDVKVSTLLALVAGGIALVAAQSDRLGDVAPILVLELLVSLTYLLFGFASRAFAYAPALPALIRDANLMADELRERYLANLRDAYLLNLKSLSIRALYFRAGIAVLVASGLTVAANAIGGTPQ